MKASSVNTIFMANHQTPELTKSELALSPFVEWETLLVSSVVSRKIQAIIQKISKVLAHKILLQRHLTKKAQTSWWQKDLYQDIDFEEMVADALQTRVKAKSLFATLISWFAEKKWIFFAAALALSFLSLPGLPPVMVRGETIALTSMGQSVVALLLMLIVFFITESVPIGAIIAIVYTWLVVIGFKPDGGEPLVSIFSSDAVFFIIGALMISQVLVKYRLHKRMLILIMKLVGSKTKNLVFGITAFSALASAFISEHTIAALMLPIGIAIVESFGGYKKVPNLAKLIMFSIGFGASIGGVGTPTGGGRNAIMIAFLKETTGEGISFGQWALMGLPFVILMIPLVTWLNLKFFKPEITDLKEGTDKIREEMNTTSMEAKDWFTITIFFIILGMWITFGHLGLGVIALLGALLYLLFNIIDWKEYEKINWGVVLLYTAAIGLGSALQDSGAANWLGGRLLQLTETIFPNPSFLTMAGMGMVTTGLLTQTMADGPTVAALGPIILKTAQLAGVSVVGVGIAVAMASSFAFMMIIGTPSNAIVASSGYLKAKDFLKVGFVLFIVSMVTLISLIAFYWMPVLGIGDG